MKPISRFAFAGMFTLLAAGYAAPPLAHGDNGRASQRPPCTEEPCAAKLDLETYNSYCLYYLDKKGHPRKARAPLLAINPNLKDGWPTQAGKTVVLKPGYQRNHNSLNLLQARKSSSDDTPDRYTNCPPYPLIGKGDKLDIVGRDGQYRLQFSKKTSREGQRETFKTSEYDLKPGTTTDGKTLWYNTPADHEDGIQYFVYMLDNGGPDEGRTVAASEPTRRYQIYLIEAFVTKNLTDGMKPVSACLDERPDYLNNVFPAPYAYDTCDYDGSLENGVGTGEEPD